MLEGARDNVRAEDDNFCLSPFHCPSFTHSHPCRIGVVFRRFQPTSCIEETHIVLATSSQLEPLVDIISMLSTAFSIIVYVASNTQFDRKSNDSFGFVLVL